MKYLIAVAFLAVASAHSAPRLADDFAPIPLAYADVKVSDIAPISLTNDAVKVVDAPMYEGISRSELETIRFELPEGVMVVESPIELAPVAPALGAPRLADDFAPIPLAYADVKVSDIAPISLTNDAVNVVDAPMYEGISRSELETIRFELPEGVMVVESPIELAQESVRVIDSPMGVIAEAWDQVKVADAPLPPAPRPGQHFYPERYNNDLLR